MKKVWLSIGSNLCNPLNQVKKAISTLSELPNTRCLSCSSYYRSKPLGVKNQPDFLNVVIIIETNLSSNNLLLQIQRIEISQGRIRTNSKWGPRTLDIDILLFGKEVIRNHDLIIPHYDIYNRAFVLYPMLELSKNLIFPNGTSLKDIVCKVSHREINLWKNTAF